MEHLKSGGAETPFRLQGEIGGVEHTFDLVVGEHRVGSSSGSDLRLRAAGVSRQHALLIVQSKGLVVEDRGSSNGTFVDGKQVHRAGVADGTELRFGPATLVVRSLVDGEGTVAIPLGEEAPSMEPSQVSSLWSEVTALQGSRWSPESTTASLRILEEVGSALAGGDGTTALRCLGESLGCSGCSWLEVSGGGPPVVVGTWGQLSKSPPRSAFEPPSGLGATSATWVCSEEDNDGFGPTWRVAAARTRHGRCIALVLWGTQGFVRGDSSLLRILARTFAADPSEATPAGQPPPARSSGSQPLRFPPGYVEGTSPPMLSLYRQMARLAATDLPILLAGPTGVGKGMIAEALHRSSARRERSLVPVNCAALPGELLEAELFGIGKGVATGVDARPGHFKTAEGGTLFLDEVGELPLPLQAKLLRALQEKEIQPVGGAPVRIDLRILAATNADLRQRIRQGTFREDLYFRLAGYLLDVPSLAACNEDLPRLVESFLRRFAEQSGVSLRGLSFGALRRLAGYGWPGNIRELEYEMRRVVLRANPGQVIDSSLLSAEILEGGRVPGPAGAAPTSGDLKDRLEALEQSLILEALGECGGMKLHAARRLGISRNSLARRIKRLGIEV